MTIDAAWSIIAIAAIIAFEVFAGWAILNKEHSDIAWVAWTIIIWTVALALASVVILAILTIIMEAIK